MRIAMAWVFCLVCTATVIHGVDAGATDGSSARQAAFLGFEPGEERQYRMAPPEALNENEVAFWRIGFVGIENNLGIFSIFHERQDPASPSPLPRLRRDEIYEDPEYHRANGELHLNAAGFPLLVTFGGTQRFINRSIEYRATYSFSTTEMKWDVQHLYANVFDAVTLPDELRIDAEQPEGLSVFYGADLRCLGRGNTVQWLADAYGLSQPCDEADLLFANPGLLEIALQMPWPPDYDWRALWFLSPVGGWFERGLPDPRPEVPPRVLDESEHYRRLSFELVGPTDVQIGGERVPAIELLIPEINQSVYVNDEGIVIRLDLGRHPVSGKPRWIEWVPPLMRSGEARWAKIGLLLP